MNRRSGIVLTVFVVIAFMSAGLIYQNSFGLLLDCAVYNSWLKSRAQPSSDKIVLVVVDEKSLDEQGKWSWPRAKHAELVRFLDQAGARVIAFDMFFPEPDEGSNDLFFAEALISARAPVVLGYYFHHNSADVEHLNDEARAAKVLALESGMSPYGFMMRGNLSIDEAREYLPGALLPESNVPIVSRSADESGFVNLPVEWFVKPTASCVVAYEGRFHPSLALATFSQYLGARVRTIVFSKHGVEGIQLNGVRIATDVFGGIGLPHSDSLEFSRVSVTDILMGRIDPSIFEGRIVMIGASAAGLGGEVMGGWDALSVHAGLVDAMISNSVVSVPLYASGIELMGIIGMAILAGLLCAKGNRIVAAIGVAGSVTLYWVTTRHMFMSDGLYFSPIYPGTSALLVLIAFNVFVFLSPIRALAQVGK